MILKQDGSVWDTGYNRYGQLGDGTASNRFNFMQVISDGAKDVAAGVLYSMALKIDDSIWATGSNTYGQFGDGGTISTKAFGRVASFGNGAGKITTCPIAPNMSWSICLLTFLTACPFALNLCLLVYHSITTAQSTAEFTSATQASAIITSVTEAEATDDGGDFLEYMLLEIICLSAMDSIESVYDRYYHWNLWCWQGLSELHWATNTAWF